MSDQQRTKWMYDVRDGVVQVIGYLGLLTSIAVILPPLLYGWLWWTSLDIPQRLDPTGDRIWAAWSAIALTVAIFHVWLCRRRIIRLKSLRAALIFLALSILVVASYPAFWGFHP
jgi:hypothetical protein